MSTGLDFKIVANNDVLLQFTVVDSAGAVVSLVGASIKWEARLRTGAAAVLTKTTSSGISITNGANGIFQVTIDAADTITLAGKYIHEAIITLSGDSVTLTNSDVTAGTLTIREQNTVQS